MLRQVLPPLEMSEVNPIQPKLNGLDLYEAICLRIDDETYRLNAAQVSYDEDGVPVTGDPIADEWERELARGVKRT